MRRLRTWVVIVVCLMAMPTAWAQRTEPGAELSVLFQAGVDAVDQGRYADAIRQGEAFNASAARLLGKGTANEAYGNLLIAMGHSYQNQSAEAVRYGERAFRAFGASLGPADVNTLGAGVLLAGDLAKTGALVAARSLIDLMSKQDVENGPAAADFFVSKAVVERFGGDYPASERAAREALRLTIAKSGKDSDAAASRMFVLAQALALQPAKVKEAQQMLAEARSLAARTYGPNHPRTREMQAYSVATAKGVTAK